MSEAKIFGKPNVIFNTNVQPSTLTFEDYVNQSLGAFSAVELIRMAETYSSGPSA